MLPVGCCDVCIGVCIAEVKNDRDRARRHIGCTYIGSLRRCLFVLRSLLCMCLNDVVVVWSYAFRCKLSCVSV